MTTDNANVTYGKAKSLKEIFPDLFPKNFAERFDPQQFAVDEDSPKKELMALLAAKPEHSKEIITFWKALFPGDKCA